MFLVELSTVPVQVLPVAELRDHLLLGSGFADDGAQDSVLEQYLRSAVSTIEERTGKALFEKQMSWTLTVWRDRECQSLPVAPVSSIDHVELIDADGAISVVDPSRYRLVPDGHRPAIRGNGTWLPAIPSGGSVVVRFTAGFGAGWADLPPSLQQAVLMLAAHFYENRGGQGRAGEWPGVISSILERFRTVRILGGGAR